MKYVLSIAVTYDAASIVDPEELEAALEREVRRRVGDGLLSPSGAEIVDEYSVNIERAE